MPGVAGGTSLTNRTFLDMLQRNTRTFMAEAQPQTIALPTTFEEFLRFEPTNGFKYKWNDGEPTKSSSIKRKHLRLIKQLNRLFLKTAALKAGGERICEQDVMLTTS